MRTCSHPGCYSAHHAQRLCQAHYRALQRARKSGTNGEKSAGNRVPDLRGPTALSVGLNGKPRKPRCHECGGRASRSVDYWRWHRRTRLSVTLHYCGPCLDGGISFIENMLPARDLVIA